MTPAAYMTVSILVVWNATEIEKNDVIPKV